MKRTLPWLGFAVLALSSCARHSDLPPEEVLRRAVLASGQLQSAAFTVDADITSSQPELTGKADVRLQGVLQDGGREAEFTVTAHGTMKQDNEDLQADLRADIVSDRNSDLFLQLQDLTFTPPHPQWSPEMIASLLHQWWSFPSGNEAGVVPVSPDPSLLRAQAEIVKVTQDRGIVERNGHDSYRYDVTIDPLKLSAFLERVAQENGQESDTNAILASLNGYRAEGELWIDAASFVVREISWSISAAEGESPYTLVITVMLDQHNAARSVSIPTEAQPFPISLDTPLSASSASSEAP